MIRGIREAKKTLVGLMVDIKIKLPAVCEDQSKSNISLLNMNRTKQQILDLIG